MEKIGRYEVQGELGRGGMGRVFRAWDPKLRRIVALKTIRFDLIAEGSDLRMLLERFQVEAQAAAGLNHPNIITIYDVGEQDGAAFLVMEFVEGRTFRQVIQNRAASTQAEILALLYDTASALDHAHEKGILHRDVKPANVLVAGNGAAKLTDFGIAKVSTATGLTQSGTILGTLHYISPEHLRGRHLDGRADQYALAVMAFEALCGTLPFDAPTTEALMVKILMEPPRQFPPGFPPEAARLIDRALAKEPERRFPTCAGFIAALGEAMGIPVGGHGAAPVRRPAGESGTIAPPEMAATGTVAMPRAPAAAATAPPPVRSRRSPPAGIALVLAAATVAIGGAAWYLNRATPPPAAVESPAPPPEPAPAVRSRPQVPPEPGQAPADSAGPREVAVKTEDREAQQAWEKIRDGRAGDPAAVDAFLRRYPDSPHAAAARSLAARMRSAEAAAWLAVRESTDAAALRSYAARFPWSEHAGEAQSRVSVLEKESAAWAQAAQSRDPKGVNAFLAGFPAGAHRGDALRLLADLAAEEEREWAKVRDTNDVEALEAFARSFPNGKRQPEAVARIGKILADREAEKAAAAAARLRPTPAAQPKPPAVTAQRPRSGRVIWQGTLPRSGAITIGGPSLTGTVLGAMPGGPATWRAFPAEIGGGTITVYSDAPRPAEGPSPRSGQQRFIYTADPKRAGRVKVTPRANGTLEVHCSDQKVKAIVLEWVAR